MSQDTVELVRRAFEAYSREGLDAVLPFVAPEAVFFPDPSWMEEREYHGRDGFAALDRTHARCWRDEGHSRAGGLAVLSPHGGA
jgi:ketosteroid isomerase-like protein